MAVDLCFFYNGHDQPLVRALPLCWSWVSHFQIPSVTRPACHRQQPSCWFRPRVPREPARPNAGHSAPLRPSFSRAVLRPYSARQGRKAHFLLHLCLGTGSSRPWLQRAPCPAPSGWGRMSAFTSRRLTDTNHCHPVRSKWFCAFLCIAEARNHCPGKVTKAPAAPTQEGMATGLHALRMSRAWP